MQRLAIILAFILAITPGLSLADDGEVFMVGFDTGAVSGGSACDNTTDYLGYPTAGADCAALTTDRLYVTRYTPTFVSACTTGTLSRAWVHEGAAVGGTAPAKICLYSSAASTPGSGDNLIVCQSVPVSGTASTWYSNSVSGSYTVDNGVNYWVGILDNTGMSLSYTSTGATMYYLTTTGWYANPPATLAGTWENVTRKQTIYFSIQ